MARSTFHYVTYIRTTPEKLWSALTDDTEFMKQYWFGVRCESKWTAGSSWKMVSPDGGITDAGEVVEAKPPARLVIRWRHRKESRSYRRRRLALHHGAGTQWDGGQALDHAYHRARAFQIDRRGIGRLAEDRLKPEVPAGDRLCRPE